MPVKFGINQIGQPSPKALKFWVNTFIIVGGVVGAIVMIAPDKYIPADAKQFILGAGGIIAAALKSIEKLTSDTDAV